MHVRLFLAGLCGLGMLAAAAAAQAGTAFLPGLYEIRVSHPDDGPGEEVTHECLTPAAAAQDSLERRLAEAVHERNCRFTQRRIGAGTFPIAGTCGDGVVSARLEQSGTFSPTSLDMNLRTTVTPAPGIAPASTTLRLSHRRLSPTCPADSAGTEPPRSGTAASIATGTSS